MKDIKRAGTEKKSISEMTEKEILRQQLELLAERSEHCPDEELSPISKVMLEISSYINPYSD